MTMGVGEKCVATLHPDKCWFIAEEEEVEEVEEKEEDDGEDEDTGGNSVYAFTYTILFNR
jgi:hypothetical protein